MQPNMASSVYHDGTMTAHHTTGWPSAPGRPRQAAALDHATLDQLRQRHPAWRLLRASHAPLVAAFLHRVFIAPNVREVAHTELLSLLEDELYALRQRHGAAAFPGSAQGYLADWAEGDRGWLRTFYPPGTDEPHHDLTPDAEKALRWLGDLTERPFVGTESRLLTLFALLRQMSEGSEADPDARLAELYRRRAEIDAEIARIQGGDVPLLDDVAVKDRFLQFEQLARGLLTDFREVEQNFRALDRRVRERITLWEGGKGALLQEIMGEHDAIAESDQGRNFRAFWDFLMSPSRQEELDELLEQVLTLPAICALQPDERLRRVHHDWLEAGEHTQRTIARLSRQLRRFLDDRSRLENRRILALLQRIEGHALALRERMPQGECMSVAATSAAVSLPMERPLFRPSSRPYLDSEVLPAEDADIDTDILFGQMVIDRAALAQNIAGALQEQGEISLAEVVRRHPLRHGLAELVGYLQLASTWPGVTVDDAAQDEVSWQAEPGVVRRASLPRIVLSRS